MCFCLVFGEGVDVGNCVRLLPLHVAKRRFCEQLIHDDHRFVFKYSACPCALARTVRVANEPGRNVEECRVCAVCIRLGICNVDLAAAVFKDEAAVVRTLIARVLAFVLVARLAFEELAPP